MDGMLFVVVLRFTDLPLNCHEGSHKKLGWVLCPPCQDARNHPEYIGFLLGDRFSTFICHCSWHGATPNFLSMYGILFTYTRMVDFCLSDEQMWVKILYMDPMGNGAQWWHPVWRSNAIWWPPVWRSKNVSTYLCRIIGPSNSPFQKTKAQVQYLVDDWDVHGS